ncbi:MAG: hypothetical protein DME60_02715 [Verrucomicrobia bacterium]|nr:MAG: hypothetical protein DME60_02715 [Verrucomicrobiota bacterium]
MKIYQEPQAANVALQSPPALSEPANAEGEWTLASPVATRIFRTQPLRSSQTHSRSRGIPPRYVLDSVPVSYESSFRF